MTTHHRRVDHTYLMHQAYANADRLETRIGIYSYQQPKINLEQEVLNAMGSVAGLTVLDVGCGNGRYARALATEGANVAAMDLSGGMLTNLQGLWARLQADAERLPVSNGSFDRVLAAHMLYHVPNPEGAITEFARVLGPAGTLVATSNTEQHLIEVRQIWDELLEDAGIDLADSDSRLMNLELPIDHLLAMLRRSFDDVEFDLLTSSLHISDPEVLVNYAASTTAALTTNEQGYELLPALAERISTLITRDSEFKVTTQVILISAKRPRNQ
ncbi:class I SAM-dependent methyltransferase [Ferrimicrobium acidiphilum]|uniref:Demethylmenaquinone methyltransferase n=3 Tax=Ferrimicrobium acidiphilum TaxID=121039 RepID=A0A0D8FW31_9ACTN|nr:class I SAM-dependent methyltransferase [Ferrimicrobium acidiphilum]KJE77296.1 demethylmenaquinone methyltransferase [Ferrimicrobium acidiphilum DSM 19497]